MYPRTSPNHFIFEGDYEFYLISTEGLKRAKRHRFIG